jgi:hypothetical protein
MVKQQLKIKILTFTEFLPDVWKEKLRSYQSYFKERENWHTEENKRPGGAFDFGENFGYEGSFRRLNLD